MLSLCMIVRDEEDFIGSAISSVRLIVDDIVVVDTGSTDRTVEIAKEFNARIFDFRWSDDFSEAKNFSISKASGDWILVLDADEIIADRDIQTLHDHTKTRDYFGYSLLQRTYCDKPNIVGWEPNLNDYEEGMGYSGFHPSRLVRLFRKDPRIKFTGRIHELVEISMHEKGLRIKDTEIPIHHFGMTRGESHFNNKLLLYAELEEKKAREDPQIYEHLVRAATLYREIGLYAKATLILDELLNVRPSCADAYHEMAIISETTGNYIKAEEHYLKSLNLTNNNAMFFYNLGNFLTKRGRDTEAIEYLRKVIELKPEHFNAHYIFGEIYYKRGDFTKSMFHFREVLRLYPANSKARHNLGVVYYTIGKKKEAAKEFLEALRISPEYSIPRFYLGLIYAENGQREDARMEIEISLRYDPQNREAKKVLEII